LQTLAMNLRWSWHPSTQDLFASLDHDAWERSGHDPVRVLGEISSARFAELAADAETVVTVRELADDLSSYLGEPRWYQSEREDDPGLPAAVGYFSMEFGVSEVLPNYSGGLGVLAGDHLKAASDLGVPLIAVGLLYRGGYFRQSLSLDGWQLETYPVLDPQGLPLHLLTDETGTPVLVQVTMPGGRVRNRMPAFARYAIRSSNEKRCVMPSIGLTKYSIIPFVSGWLMSKRYSSPSQTTSTPAASCVAMTIRVASIRPCSDGAATSHSGTGYDPTTVVLMRGAAVIWSS